MDDLAAKKPAPGGGSAAALVGAAGVALLSMVCNFTLGKEKYKKYEKDIKRILSETESARLEFQMLIDEDVAAYSKYSSSDKDEAALKEVLATPLKVCRLARKTLKLCPELAEKGNKFLISDIDCGEELLRAAFSSGVFNVMINLSGIKDEAYKQKIETEIDKE